MQMFKINKKIEYSLMVLKHFYQEIPAGIASARQICDAYHTPFDSTSKVMQIMSSAGILKSEQGVSGGYKLNTDLSKLTYLNLAELIEGRSFSHNCHELRCSLIESCNITGPVSKLNGYLNSFFKTLTIKELLDDSPMEIIQKSVSEA